MFCRTFRTVLIVALITGFVLASAAAYAQDPTIPTRTPTPDPNAATATSVPPTSESGGGDNVAPPSPTATTQPGVPPPGAAATPVGPTATTMPGSTAPGGNATVTATPDGAIEGAPGGGIEVAPGGTFVVQECGTQPYVAAIRDILVYAGPGVDYPVISSLQRPEIRPIMGRAEFAPWWYIQLTTDLTGWVADADVDEFGDTGGVQLQEPPDLNEVQPTRGPLWQPTPIPFAACTATPTATATATETAGEAEAIVSTEAEGGDDGSGGGSDAEEAISVADITAAGSRGQSGLESNNGATNARLLQEAGLLGTTGGSGFSSPLSGYLFPLLGAGLIGAGLLLALMARSQSSKAASSSAADGNQE